MKRSALSMVIDNIEKEEIPSTEIPKDLNKVEYIGMEGDKAKFIIDEKEVELDVSELYRTRSPEETGLLYTSESGLLKIIPMTYEDMHKLEWIIHNIDMITSIYSDINDIQKEIKKISEVIDDMNFIERVIYRKKIKRFKEYMKQL